jgi:predicted transcriptional regulator
MIWQSIIERDPGFVEGEKLTPSQRKSRIKASIDLSNKILERAKKWIELTSSLAVLTNDQKEVVENIATETEAISQLITKVFSDDTELVKRARQLKRGEDLGLIKIQQFGIPSHGYLRYDEEKLVFDVNEALSAANSYGALDERFVIPLKSLKRGQIEKQKVTQVAVEMFRRLPLFEEASFDEIRDIKQELGIYLANFRRGLIEISEQIRSQPWDKDFPHDVERELRVRLLPEVAALEDKVNSNSYLKQLIHRAAKDPLVLPASSALGMILSNSLHASTIASQLASAIAGAGILAFEAHKEWKEEKKKVEKNLLFFYFRAGKLLNRRRGRAAIRRK